jgi:antirestriction protein ArdC
MRPKNKSDKPPPPLRDHRQEITDDIVKMLESGNIPWEKPWAGGSLLPYNPTTGLPYRGGNIISLMVAGMQHGYTDPRWLTFNQAKEAGWLVKLGEHVSGRIEWYGNATSKKDGEEEVDDSPRHYVARKCYGLFNAEQIEGIPPIVTAQRKPFEVIEAGEKILADSGAVIKHGGHQTYYNRKTDHVQLPEKDCFTDAPTHYSTACHELAHWSGHPSRLNRETLTESYKFGDQSYASEELVAEVASAFMAAETGIPYNTAQTAAYLQSWIKASRTARTQSFMPRATLAKPQITFSVKTVPLNNQQKAPMRQQYRSQDSQQPAHSERQEYHRSNVAIGVSHILKLAGALSPLVILEFVKEPTKAHRYIRMASIATPAVTETLWTTRARRSNTEERHR